MFDHYYVADIENTTGGDSTYVYGAAIAEVDTTNGFNGKVVVNDEVHIFENLDDFMWFLTKLPKKTVIYFHNFANYDGWIILDWLLNHGYVYTTDKRIRKRFTGIITDDRQIYQLKVRLNGKHTIEFRDTCKLVAGKLDKIGKNFKCKTSFFKYCLSVSSMI